MKVSAISLLVAICSVAGCSQKPSYDFMVNNFNENKPTFSMIATIACEIGEEIGQPSYAIRGKTAEEETLLELADRVNVEAISYQEINGKCELSMPVWESELQNKHQQFAYRYNINKPSPFNARSHRYKQIVKSVKEGKAKSVLFDMKLSKRWFFSFMYR